MQVTLPPELELIVSRQLTSGKYQNAIEVIRTAITSDRRTQLTYLGSANKNNMYRAQVHLTVDGLEGIRTING